MSDPHTPPPSCATAPRHLHRRAFFDEAVGRAKEKQREAEKKLRRARDVFGSFLRHARGLGADTTWAEFEAAFKDEPELKGVSDARTTSSFAAALRQPRGSIGAVSRRPRGSCVAAVRVKGKHRRGCLTGGLRWHSRRAWPAAALVGRCSGLQWGYVLPAVDGRRRAGPACGPSTPRGTGDAPPSSAAANSYLSIRTRTAAAAAARPRRGARCRRPRRREPEGSAPALRGRPE
jgi:hypothetical protein